MPPAITIKDDARESELFLLRVRTALGVLFLCALLLVGRMVQLQLVDYDHFKTLSDDNQISILPIAPTRGLIFDRNGILLAQNTPTYTLEVVPEAVEDMGDLIARLRELMEISERDERRFHSMRRKKRRFESIPLRSRLNVDEVARFSVNRHFFPGVDVRARLTRNYPLGPLGVHVVGYVGRINQRELQRVDVANYRASSYIGKTGVEDAYEDVLHGSVGYEHVETNARGRTLRVLKRIDPKPGKNLYLSIDVSLQATAERALDGAAGAIVAVETSTGAVLAMASIPGFDPNLFVHGIEPEKYRELLESTDRPLFNRALHGQYPPGSTIKPFVGLAGLEVGGVGGSKTTWCPGWFSLPGFDHRYRDWKRGGHGKVKLKDAIAQSCDIYFYNLALDLGIDRIHEFLGRFGFGQRTGIDLQREARGLNPSRDWKKRARNQPWFPGETVISGIGQGFNLATPLQLASATATLASRGYRVRPRLVSRQGDPLEGAISEVEPYVEDQIQLKDASRWEMVIDAMVEVVHGRAGTARKIGVGAPYKIAGKTGTAQVFGVGQDESYKELDVIKKLRDHALFIAFAPAQRPQIALSVVVENGGSGSRSAAPVARRVLDYFLGNRLHEPGDGPLRVTSSDNSMSPGARSSAVAYGVGRP